MDFRSQIQNQVFGVRATALIVQDRKLFLAKRGDTYRTIGGAVEVNETTEKALVREVREELGVEVAVSQLAFVVENWFTVGETNFHNIEFHYLAHPLGDLPEVMVEGGKTRSCEWVSIENLENLDIRPDFLKRELKGWDGQIKHIINK